MRYYRGVGSRCAFDLPVHARVRSDVVQKLHTLGFTIEQVDLGSLARSCIGARYKRGAKIAEAPYIFDCGSFLKWLYAQKGVWLPRNLLEWTSFGKPISNNDLRPGDLVFTSGYTDYSAHSMHIGHVAVAVDANRVVHATNPQVQEQSLEDMLAKRTFQCARRLLSAHTVTLHTPITEEIETSTDVGWLLARTGVSTTRKAVFYGGA